MNHTSPKRVAIYCRISDPKQERGASLATQEQSTRAYCAERGWTIADVCHETHSADDLWERPGLTALRERVRAGDFDVLLAHALDRISRNQVHLGVLLDECERYGVTLLFSTEDFEATPEGKLLMSVKGFVAEMERVKIRERSVRGTRHRVEALGKPLVGGHPPYGYAWKADKSALVRDESTAPIVERIFRAYSTGTALRPLAWQLMREGIPSPHGRDTWSMSSVRHILGNRTYRGVVVAYKEKQTIEYRDGRKMIVKRARSVEEQVELPAGIAPVLIDEETFETVQRRLASAKAESPRNATDHTKWLLRGGIARCGYCGHSMTGRTIARKARPGGTVLAPQYVYQCSRWLAYRDCQAHGIAAHILDGAAWATVQRIRREPAIIRDAFTRRRAAMQIDVPDTAAIDRDLEEVIRQQARATQTILALDDADAAAPLRARLKELAVAKRALEADRDRIVARRTARDVAHSQLDDVMGWVSEYLRGQDITTYEGKREALKRLKVTALVYRGDHDPRYEIAASFTLGADSTTPRVPRESAQERERILRMFAEADERGRDVPSFRLPDEWIRRQVAAEAEYEAEEGAFVYGTERAPAPLARPRPEARRR